ncbi:lipoate--protein ligase [Paenibacillus mendelii]|uniref:lipoate--protein ligase n=1 Tax=Paenibacillus mendelii TaxID=206163 RepID=A0ABV6JC54_9BACL|nr:lipoate--protein ligase [Paenibacillus mendelii]MCQ6559793.1 lipoate--protein ligase [Paenibacillus mendelii]
MLFIDNRGNTDPAFNLALEEYALRNLLTDDSYLLFYINEPSIIIGKNQNTIEEINADYVRDHKLHVVRRLSGGGAVYHDLGNLNFSFITKDDGNSFHNFAKFTQPVIDALHKLGVHAELTGRNDIQVGDRKISGNAQFATKGRMFSHGTLLFDSAMENVASALKVKPIKIESKGTKSVRGRVANISEFLSQTMTTEQFRTSLLRELFNCEPAEVPQYKLSDAEWDAVSKLAEERYRSWDWNYGRSPKCNIQNIRKFASGIIDARLDVEDGKIAGIRLFGDYFGAHDVAELEQLLIHTRYEEEALRQAIASVDLTRYFGKLTEEEFIGLLMLRD